jgi:phenylalanyl-tRNA synthetase beta chain
VREALVRQGLQEVYSHSLTAPSALATEAEAARRVIVRSALSPELSSLRTSLLPNLLHVAARAHAAGIRDIAVFEVGPIYLKAEAGDGYREPLRVSGVLTGSALPSAWSLKPEAYPMDLFFAKGVVAELLGSLGIRNAVFAPATHPITHPSRTAAVTVGEEPIGWIAELSEATVETQDLPRRTYVFDLDGAALLRLAADTQIRFAPLPKYPAVVRDLAPVFPASTPYAEIESAATIAAGPLLESLRLTDVYTGANVGEGNRSLTLRFTFRSPAGTLKEAEVEAVLVQVRDALTSIGGDFRGV